MEYINDTHKTIMEAIKAAGIEHVKYPIMLTATQKEPEYNIAINWSGTGIHIDKSKIDAREISDINASYDGERKFILNNVWTATF